MREAVALLHEHRVSQLPVVMPTTTELSSGSVGERGCSNAAMATRRCWPRGSSRSWSRHSPPSRPATRSREAVELLSGERPGAARGRARAARGHRHAHRPARGAGLMSDRDGSRRARCTPASSPTRLRLGDPGDPPDLDLRQGAPGRFLDDYDYSRSRQPDARALETRTGRPRGRARHRVLLGHGGRARADHRGLLGRRARRHPRRPVRRDLPARRQGTVALGASRTRWSTRPTSRRWRPRSATTRR